MSQKVNQNDELEEMLVGMLGIILVLVGAAAVYFLITGFFPNDFSAFDAQKDRLSKWIWLFFGIFFFLYGAVGVVKGKIGVGWRVGYYQETTILEGTGAFISSVGTAIGGLLMLLTSAIFFYPFLGITFHALATLVCGFVSVFLSWACGAIIRALRY